MLHCNVADAGNIRVEMRQVEAGWMGNKEMVNYRAQLDMQSRLRIARNARATGTLVRRSSNCFDFSVEKLILVVNSITLSKHVWRRLQVWIKEGVLEVMQSCEVLNANWDGSQYNMHVFNHQENKEIEPLAVNHLWLATGTSVDAMSDMVLRILQDIYPTRMIGGFPQLENDCSWPGLPFYVIGRLSTFIMVD